jgi:hypothetical protein
MDPKGVVSGYTRAAKNLIQTVVRNAGHYVRSPPVHPSHLFFSEPPRGSSRRRLAQVAARVIRRHLTHMQCHRCLQISLKLRSS